MVNVGVLMADYAARVHRDGVAGNSFVAGGGQREQASDSRDRALDEGFVGAEEWTCSQDLFQGWGG